ncbi:MAG: hypothetical protein WBX17_03560, partial [Microbacterium sp.]
TYADHSSMAVLGRDVEAAQHVLLRASSISESSALAEASAAGAPENEDSGDPENPGGGAGTGVDQLANQQRGYADAQAAQNGGRDSGDTENPSAETSEGGVAVAAAIGIVVAEVHAESLILPEVAAITAGGQLRVESAANTDARSGGDGSSVSSGGDANIGVGVALTLATTVNRSIVPATLSATAGDVVVSATVAADGDDVTGTYGATAASGAGGGNISVAGSVAIAIITTDTLATVLGTLALTSGDVAVAARSAIDGTVTALPHKAGDEDGDGEVEGPGGEDFIGGVSTEGDFGLGAAFVLVLDTHRTSALIGDDVVISGAQDVVVSAEATDAVTAEAKMGAKGGGVAIAPAISIVLSTVTTTARIGTGSLETSGDVWIRATQIASALNTTTAAAIAGTDAAVGISFALTIPNHDVVAELARTIDAGGSLTLQAYSASASSAKATASAAGAPENEADSGSPDPENQGGTAGNGIDQFATQQRGYADQRSSESGGSGSGDAETPSAETSEGPVAVAAAVGIVVATIQPIARITEDVTELAAVGPVRILSSHNTDVATGGDGSSVSEGASATIGVGIAISWVDIVNHAVVPEWLTITAGGLVVGATTTADTTGDRTSIISAEAASGAGGGKISVAGSVAIAQVNADTLAAVYGDVLLTGDDADAVVMATDALSTTAKALPKGDGVVSTGNVGVGASVALALVFSETHALIADGVAVTGADDLTVAAASESHTVNEAKMGAKGGGVTVTPAIGITVSEISTTAVIGTLADALEATGDVFVIVEHATSAHTTTDAEAGEAATAVGVSLALNFAFDVAFAQTRRDVVAGGSAVFTVTGSALADATAKASTSGAPAQNDEGGAGAGGVDGQIAQQRSYADQQTTANRGSGMQSNSSPSASTSGGSVSVAAAIALSIADASFTAHLPDGLSIMAGGHVWFLS